MTQQVLAPGDDHWANKCIPYPQPARTPIRASSWIKSIAALFFNPWLLLFVFSISVGYIHVPRNTNLISVQRLYEPIFGTFKRRTTPASTAIWESDEDDCFKVLTSMNNLSAFPLPHTIDQEVHEYVLKALEVLYRYPVLVDAHHATRDNLANTINNLIGFVHLGAKKYSRSLATVAIATFRLNAQLILDQLQLALDSTTQLAAIYNDTKNGCDGIYFNSFTAWEQGQMSSPGSALVYARPVVMPGVVPSLDPNAIFLDPWEEIVRNYRAAAKAHFAWERNQKRLMLIIRALRELEGQLLSLIKSLSRPKPGTDACGDDLRHLEAAVSLQQDWLFDWWQQHSAGGRQTMKELVELAGSVGDDEEVLEISIKPEWCKRR